MFLGVWHESYLFVQKEVGYAVSFPVPGGQDLEVIGQLIVWICGVTGPVSHSGQDNCLHETSLIVTLHSCHLENLQGWK